MRKVLSLRVLPPLLIFFGACRDAVRPPDASVPAYVISQGNGIGELPRFPELAEQVGGVRVDQTELPAEESDAVLVAKVQRAGGVVHVGFKPPSAAATRSTGMVPAMTRAEVLSYRGQIVDRGAELLQTFRNLSAVVARIPPELAPELRRLPFVNYVEAETWGHADGASSPTHFVSGDSMSQDTSWGAHKIGAPEVWSEFGYVGQNTTITMIDTGLDSVHVANSLRDGPWGTLPGDCLYVASITNTCLQQEPPNGRVHGSHVAGIASARDNGQGWIGIAHGVHRFASVRIFNADSFSNSALASALDWTVSNGYARQVVNMSLRSCENASLVAEAISESFAAGNLLVAAAGNVQTGVNCGGSIGTTGVTYPGRYSVVFTVSGTTPTDGFALASSNPCPFLPNFGSRFGSQVDIAAPFWDTSMVANGIWEIDCGTSMASPKVAGAAAVLWSAHQTWSANDVVFRLCITAVQGLGDQDHFGCGRVSISNAFATPVQLYAAMSGPIVVNQVDTCWWTGFASGGTPPYTYQWSGALSGTGESISGADVFGDLYLTVTSGDGQVAEANPLFITQDEEASC